MVVYGAEFMILSESVRENCPGDVGVIKVGSINKKVTKSSPP
jgi:hypothetical protein